MRSFARAVALITVFAVMTRAIGFFFRIFLSRILGAEMLGIYQIAMSFFMVFLTLISSGLPLAISKQVATGKKKGIVSAGLVISLTASLFLCLIVFVFQNLFSALFTDERCIAILIALIPSIIAASVYTVIRAVWWGEKKFFLLGITELLEQVLRVIIFVIMLALAFLFVDLSQIAALSYTFACAIAAAVVVIIFLKSRSLAKKKRPNEQIDIGKKQKHNIFKNEQFKPLLKSALPITGVRLVASITMPVISILIPMRLMAAGWSSAAAIAGFGVLVGMTMPLLTIPQTVISSLSTALVPELSSAHQQQNNESVTRQIQNSLKFTLFINFILLAVFMAIGEGIGIFLYADQTSGVFLSQFAWAMIPMSMSQITNAILNSLGAETRAMKNYFLGAIALFAAVWFLPAVMGVSALVVGMGACMGIASILNLMLITKLTRGNANAKAQVKSITWSVLSQALAFTLVTIPSILAGIFLQGIIQHIFPLFVSLCISGGVTMVIFMVLCQLFNIITVSSFRATFSSSAAKRKDNKGTRKQHARSGN